MSNKKEIAKAVLNEPEFLFTVTERVKTKKWGAIIRTTEIQHDVYVTGATAHTLLKVAGLIEELKIKSEKESAQAQMYDLINSNMESLVQFLAIVIHNKPTPVPHWLTQSLMNDFSMEQLQELNKTVYGRLGVESFFEFMELIHEFQIVQSPKGQQEAKAPGQPS